MIDRIREQLIAKRRELERKNNLRSLEVINWIDELLKMIEEKPQPKVKEIRVEIPEVTEELVEEAVEAAKEELKKPAPKRKIVFKKK